MTCLGGGVCGGVRRVQRSGLNEPKLGKHIRLPKKVPSKFQLILTTFHCFRLVPNHRPRANKTDKHNFCQRHGGNGTNLKDVTGTMDRELQFCVDFVLSVTVFVELCGLV
jgi:hypothetical protein